MLEVGNGGMTYREYRTHMTLWSIQAAPLIAGADLRRISPSDVGLLRNKYMISINQDRFGAPGEVVSFNGQTLIVAKRLTNGRLAISVTNLLNGPVQVSNWFNALGKFGLKQSKQYVVTDVWGNYHRAAERYVEARLERHDSALFIITPVTAAQAEAFNTSEKKRLAYEQAEEQRLREEASQRYAAEKKAQRKVAPRAAAHST